MFHKGFHHVVSKSYDQCLKSSPRDWLEEEEEEEEEEEAQEEEAPRGSVLRTSATPTAFYWTDIKLTTARSGNGEPDGFQHKFPNLRSAARSYKSLQARLKKSCHFTRNKLS